MANKYLEKIAKEVEKHQGLKRTAKGTAIGAGVGAVGGYAGGATAGVGPGILAAAATNGRVPAKKIMHSLGKIWAGRVAPVGAAVGLGAGATYHLMKKRKEKKHDLT
jgi:hypothetical protein